MRKSAQVDNSSLKTFFIYGSIVLFFILASLLVKAVFVIQESKFDGKHQFVLSLYKDNKIKEVIKFSPQESKIFVVPTDKDFGVISDAKLNYNFDLPLGGDASKTMRTIGFKYNSITTSLTIYDVFRLMIMSYTVPAELVNEAPTSNFFVDESISAENSSIQIINASGISGAGGKLEDSLGKLGCNVISVTTARKEEDLSRIQYSGEVSYTVKKIGHILNFPLEKVDKTKIADIVVIIGKNK